MGALQSDLAQLWARMVAAMNHPTTPTWVLAIAAGIALGLVLAVLWRVGRALRSLRAARRQGERFSTVARAKTLPLTCFRRDGSAGDPLNVRIIGTARQLGAAMAAGGWYRADEVTLVTSLRISVDAVLARKYSTAPLSDLYLYGRRQDYGFEYPGPNVRERDHVRLWDSGLRDAWERAVWIGAATRDVAVVISPVTHLPTHKISGNVDAEREFLVERLVETGWVIEQDTAPGFGTPTVASNGYGDTYETDGQVTVLVLANVPVLVPFADNVRGPFAGPAQVAARVLRWRLPQRGRERAKQLRARARERATSGTRVGRPDGA